MVVFENITEYLNSAPLMEVPVVFHFVSDNNGNNFLPGPLEANPWDTDKNFGSYNAFVLMLGLNNRMQNLVRDDSTANPSDPQNLFDSRIRFKFKYPNYSSNNFRFYSNSNQIILESNAMNIVVSGTLENSSGGYNVGGSASGLGYSSKITLLNFAKLQLDLNPNTSIHYKYETVIIHEFGHLMSLNHTFHCANRCSGIAFNFAPNDKEECCGICKNHN